MNILRYTSCLSLFLALFCTSSFSQESSLFSNYYLSPFIVNPAATGTEFYPMAVVSARKQWLGIPESPGTYYLSANYRIGTYDFYDPKGLLNKGPLDLKDRIGLGASLYQDKNGPQKYLGGIISYAYHVPIKATSDLSFGLAVVGTHYSFDNSLLRPDQPNDNYLLTGNDNIFKLNFNLGVYYHSPSYFVGLSAVKILPDILFIGDKLEMQPSYFLIGGYKYKFSKSISWEPFVTVKKKATENVSLDIFSKIYINRLNWVSLSYSTTSKVNFMFGIHLIKMFYAGYSYEYSISKIASFTYGSHEIYLGINLGLFGEESIRKTIYNTQ